MKNNHHAIIDPDTGVVVNVVVWEGNEWQPPRHHYVVHNCDATLGDYWDQDHRCFYTPAGKRRQRNEKGLYREVELSEEEKKRGMPERLQKVFAFAKKHYNRHMSADLTQQDNPVPDMSVPDVSVPEE
jgi:hypothetical protein